MGNRNFPGTAPCQGDGHINVKRFCFREVEISDQAFGMDILCTEEEMLPLFHHMCHVVVGAITPVANVDILSAGESHVTVYNVAKCAKFVFLMHGLEDCVRIDVIIKVKKSIDMDAVDAVCGVAGEQKYSGGGSSSGLLTESLNSTRTDSSASGLSFARCWFSAGRKGIFDFVVRHIIGTSLDKEY